MTLWTPLQEGKYTFPHGFVQVEGNILALGAEKTQIDWESGPIVEIRATFASLRLCIGTETPFVPPEIIFWVGLVVKAVLDDHTRFAPEVTIAAACLTDWAHEHSRQQP